MSRKTGIPLAILLVLVLTYPLDAWLIGIGIEHRITQDEQAALARAPYLSILSRSYRRGIYGAVEEVTIGVRFWLPQGLRRTSTAADPPPLFELTARNTIHHGPLPQLRTFAYATSDTELLLPPALAQALQPVLHGEAPLRAHSRFGWSGARSAVITSPAFATTLASGAHISWRGIKGSSVSSRHAGSVAVALTAPGLVLEKGTSSLHADDLTVEARLHKAFETLYVGTMKLSLASAEIKGAWGRANADATVKTAQLHNLAVTGDTTVQGDYLDTGGSLTLQGLESEAFSASNLAYEFGFRHLYGPTYAQLTTDLQTASQASYAQGATPGESVRLLTEVWRKDGVELLLHDPVLEIPRVAFTMPEGQMLVSARLAAPGIRREELQGAPAAIMLGLVPHLQATADLRIDADLLTRFLSESKNGGMAAQIEAFERAGYLKRDGKALTTHLTYERGQLLVNGQPFKPGAH
jgi:uncharacterized protein YdgA (DUF945 family)